MSGDLISAIQRLFTGTGGLESGQSTAPRAELTALGLRRALLLAAAVEADGYGISVAEAEQGIRGQIDDPFFARMWEIRLGHLLAIDPALAPEEQALAAIAAMKAFAINGKEAWAGEIEVLRACLRGAEGKAARKRLVEQRDAVVNAILAFEREPRISA